MSCLTGNGPTRPGNLMFAFCSDGANKRPAPLFDSWAVFNNCIPVYGGVRKIYRKELLVIGDWSYLSWFSFVFIAREEIASAAYAWSTDFCIQFGLWDIFGGMEFIVYQNLVSD